MSDSFDPAPFARLLRYWRRVHGVSQESLALALESSARHVSRLENGRVRASRAMVLKIAQHLEMGERDRNQLLSAAGYGVEALQVEIIEADERLMRRSTALLLEALEPAPAMLFDGSLRIRAVNQGWLDLLGEAKPKDPAPPVSVYIDFLFKAVPAEDQPRRWRDSQYGILLTLEQSAVLYGDDAALEMIEALRRRHDLPTDWRLRAARFEPQVSWPVSLRTIGGVRRFSALTTVISPRGPTNYAAQAPLMLKALLPKDAAPSAASTSTDHPLHWRRQL